MAVKIFKIVGGDFILGDEQEPDPIARATNTNHVVLVKSPIRLIVSENGIMLAMWMPHDQNELVSISRQHIIAEALAVEPLANEYRERMGGIITAPASLLVP